MSGGRLLNQIHEGNNQMLQGFRCNSNRGLGLWKANPLFSIDGKGRIRSFLCDEEVCYHQYGRHIKTPHFSLCNRDKYILDHNDLEIPDECDLASLYHPWYD